MRNSLFMIINIFRKIIKKLTGIADLVRLAEEQRNIAAYIAWKQVLKDKKYSDPRNLLKHGFSIHSQAEED